MRALLSGRPDFRRVFLAHAISRAGDAFNLVALVVLVLELSDSALGVAGSVALEIVPAILFAPFAGALVDRFSRRDVMIVADVARAGFVLLLALNTSSLPLAYVVAFALATGSVVFNPAASALLPDLVDESELVDANTAMWTVAVALQVVIAPIAGAVVGFAGMRWAFGINAASYAVSALCLRGAKADRRQERLAGTGWREVFAGMAAVRRTPLLARLAIVQALAALSAGATGGLLVVLATDRLEVSPAGFGALFSAIGLGAVLGPLVLRRFVRPGARSWLFGPIALRGLVDVTLSVVRSPFVAAGALGLYGVGTSTGMVAFQSTIQTSTSPELRGRVFAMYDFSWNACRLVSLAVGGALADSVGVASVYLAGGGLLLFAAAVGFAPQRAGSS
jgi:MFS family permease